MTLDAISELWKQPELSLSAVGDRLGLSRSVIAGMIGRARRAGDDRFPARPKPASKRAIKAGMSSDDARVALPNAGRQLVRPLASAPKPVVLKPAPVEEAQPQPEPTKAQVSASPVPFAELPPGRCRWPVNSPERGGVFLCCSAPIAKLRGNYCEAHARISVSSPSPRATAPSSQPAR